MIQAYGNIGSEKSSTDVYLILLMGYARSPFRESVRYLRIFVGLDERKFKLILRQ